jgi:hypothetical protein
MLRELPTERERKQHLGRGLGEGEKNVREGEGKFRKVSIRTYI